MDDRQFRETARNIRAKDFLTENAADFAGNAVATAKIAALTARTAKVEQEFENQLEQGGEVRADYAVYKDALEALLDEMREIRDFAHSMARDMTGLEEKFRLPRNRGNAAIIAAAYVFAKDAEEVEQTFLDYGMDADFIARLREKADAARDAKAAAEASTGGRVGATGTLKQDVDAASETVETIDPIVKRVYRDNPTKRAAWIYASHVERHTPKPRTPPTN